MNYKLFQENDLVAYQDLEDELGFQTQFYQIALHFRADEILYHILQKHDYLPDYYQVYQS